jgi:hypothetical protein
MDPKNRPCRRTSFFLGLLLSWTVSIDLYPYSSAAVLPLLISNSPGANGMGGTYTASFADDPLAVHFNPAFAGRIADQYLFSGTLRPVKTPWLRTFVDDMYMSSQTYQIGYHLQRHFPKIPVSIGAGYMRHYFYYGKQERRDEFNNTLGTYESWDRFSEFSIGLCLDYFIKASAGITLKQIESNLSDRSLYGLDVPKAEADARDLGVLLEIPLLPLAQRFNFLSNPSSIILPYFTPVVNYSVCNIGDKITYVDAAQSDPLPRTVTVGIGYETGILTKLEGMDWKILSMKWAVEEEDMLVERDPFGNSKYLGGLADIDPFNDLIMNRGNFDAIKHKGKEINLFEFIMFRDGRYEDMEGHVCYRTHGIGMSLSGALKLIQFYLPSTSRIGMIHFLSEHLDIQYNSSSTVFGYHGHPLEGTKYKGMTARIR